MAAFDALVSLEPATSIDGFVPRTTTGFQVKQSDMPRRAIIKEIAVGWQRGCVTIQP
jgi:hypothetical protein